jgi:hypothetical protein
VSSRRAAEAALGPARATHGQEPLGRRPEVLLGIWFIHVSFVFYLDTDAAFVALIFKKEPKTTRSMFLFVRLR